MNTDPVAAASSADAVGAGFPPTTARAAASRSAFGRAAEVFGVPLTAALTSAAAVGATGAGSAFGAATASAGGATAWAVSVVLNNLAARARFRTRTPPEIASTSPIAAMMNVTIVGSAPGRREGGDNTSGVGAR